MNSKDFFSLVTNEITNLDHEYNSKDYDEHLKLYYDSIPKELASHFGIPVGLAYEYLKSIVQYSLDSTTKTKTISKQFLNILYNTKQLLKMSKNDYQVSGLSHQLGPFFLTQIEDRIPQAKHFSTNDQRIRFRVKSK